MLGSDFTACIGFTGSRLGCRFPGGSVFGFRGWLLGFRLGSGLAFWGSGWVQVGFWRLGVQVGFRLGSGLAVWGFWFGFRLEVQVSAFLGVQVGFRFGVLGSGWFQVWLFGVQVGFRFGFWGSGWVQVGFSYSICKNTAFPHQDIEKQHYSV